MSARFKLGLDPGKSSSLVMRCTNKTAQRNLRTGRIADWGFFHGEEFKVTKPIGDIADDLI